MKKMKNIKPQREITYIEITQEQQQAYLQHGGSGIHTVDQVFPTLFCCCSVNPSWSL